MWLLSWAFFTALSPPLTSLSQTGSGVLGPLGDHYQLYFYHVVCCQLYFSEIIICISLILSSCGKLAAVYSTEALQQLLGNSVLYHSPPHDPIPPLHWSLPKHIGYSVKSAVYTKFSLHLECLNTVDTRLSLVRLSTWVSVVYNTWQHSLDCCKSVKCRRRTGHIQYYPQLKRHSSKVETLCKHCKDR